MTIYVIVEKDSNLIQEDEDGMLCCFTERERAESVLRRANNPARQLDILECEVKRLSKT